MTLEESKIELQRAWNLRNSQSLEAAEEAYRRLHARSIADRGWQLELRLLHAALLRGRKQTTQSDEVLLLVKKEIDQLGITPTFQYYLQRGLNIFYSGYFPSALEFFARAQDLAVGPEQKTLALGNYMCCLDNLNLPTEKVREKLEALASELPADHYRTVIEPQLETFARRRAFRAGDIVTTMKPIADATFSQAHYFQLWVGQLPYVRDSFRQTDVTGLAETANFLWKNYRLQTLSRDSRFLDEETVKISEKIDRLYLWLWKWMLAPDSIPAEAIEKCWKSLDPIQVCEQTTAEDFVILQLCLRWTRLFDPRWETPSQEWLKKSLPPKLVAPPLFQLEGQVLDYLEALKNNRSENARNALRTLRQNALYGSPHLQFTDLVRGARGEKKSPDPLFRLGQELARGKNGISKKSVSSAAAAQWVLIDLATNLWKKGAEQGVSKPLCLLLKGLSDSGTMSFEDLMRKGFSISHYDGDLHRHKVMNLLTRARKIVGNGLQIYTRDQRIYLKAEMKAVRFSEGVRETVKWSLPDLFDQPCMERGPQQMDRWVQPRLVVKKLNGKDRVTRQELQDLLRLSKSTINRLLLRWQDEGFITPHQSGRSMYYRVDNTYFFRPKSSAS